MVITHDEWFNKKDGEQAFSVLGSNDSAVRAKR
jgi:hypothetical protein